MFDAIRNKLVPFIIMALFAIMAAMLPEILGDHAKNILEKYLGPSYPIILIVCFLLLFILVVSLKAGHLFQLRSFKKVGYYEIAGTDANRHALQNAKNAVGNDEPEDAIKILSGLRLEALESELSSLSARLNRLKRTQIQGTESFDTMNREQNKINRDILSLIDDLEKELSESFAYYESIRASLKERYEKRLSQKLSRRQPVNLRLAPSTKGSSQQAAAAFIQFSEEEIPDRLIEYFKKSKGRLLLVGAPGSGKTTLLLQLVLELLESETTYLPVILNLARWSNNFRTLEEWMQEILPSELGLMISKKAAANLIAQNRLILLLDGFDEVAEEDREFCLTAIGNYSSESNRRFVISSRISEYEKIRKSAPVHSQVEVGLLTISQLEEQLTKAAIEKQPEARRLLIGIQEDKLLRIISTTPFYFNMLQLIFAKGKHYDELKFQGSTIEKRQLKVIEYFINEELNTKNERSYNLQQAKKYLAFVASRLNQNKLIDFELTSFQYNWWKWKGEKFLPPNY